jgi:hypothetical protein
MRCRLPLFPLFLPTVCLLAYSSIGNCQGLELGGKLLAAIRESSDAFATLDSLHDTAQQALDGQKVSAGTNWATLAEEFKKAASDAENAPLPPDVAVSEPVSGSELSNCQTRDSSIERLSSYLQSLIDERNAGEQSIQQLNRQIAAVAARRRAIAYLIEVHEKLISVPIYGKLFEMDWIDLNTAVVESLGELDSAFRNQKKKYSANVDLLGVRISNLRSNISLLKPCISGTWMGTGTSASLASTGGVTVNPCYENTTRGGITISISIAENGAVTGGYVKEVDTSTFNPPQLCLLKTGTYQFYWRLSSGSTSGDTVHATFLVWYPQMNIEIPPDVRLATFEGRVGKGRLTGELTITFLGSGPTVHHVY